MTELTSGYVEDDVRVSGLGPGNRDRAGTPMELPLGAPFRRSNSPSVGVMREAGKDCNGKMPCGHAASSAPGKQARASVQRFARLNLLRFMHPLRRASKLWKFHVIRSEEPSSCARWMADLPADRVSPAWRVGQS